MANTNSSDANLVAIISHITLIGWIIALIMNSNNKSELGNFYIRQTLGIHLLSLLFYIPFIGWIIGIGVLILWVLSLIGAVSSERKELPVVGEYFQDWFKEI